MDHMIVVNKGLNGILATLIDWDQAHLLFGGLSREVAGTNRASPLVSFVILGLQAACAPQEILAPAMVLPNQC